jgi:hypothetical protein
VFRSKATTDQFYPCVFTGASERLWAPSPIVVDTQVRRRQQRGAPPAHDPIDKRCGAIGCAPRAASKSPPARLVCTSARQPGAPMRLTQKPATARTRGHRRLRYHGHLLFPVRHWSTGVAARPVRGASAIISGLTAPTRFPREISTSRDGTLLLGASFSLSQTCF